MLKSKWFCVAVEGATATDGRTIEKSWLTDIAATYDRKTYGARVNMEHIRGFSPDPPFNAYGDVLAVKTDEITLSIGGKDVKKTALFAQIEPTAALKAITDKKQKIYTSIEVAPDFAKSGKAGLVGLAATDSPASLGTDILAFSATKDNPAAAALKAAFDGRKQDPANVFSAAYETTIELEAAPAGDDASFKDLLGQALKELFGKKEEPKPVVVVETPPAADPGAAFTVVLEGALGKFGELMSAELGKVRTDFASLRADHDALKTSLDNTEKRSTPRGPATGGKDRELADF